MSPETKERLNGKVNYTNVIISVTCTMMIAGLFRLLAMSTAIEILKVQGENRALQQQETKDDVKAVKADVKEVNNKVTDLQEHQGRLEYIINKQK